MALGKMVLVERGTFVSIRDEADQEVGFGTFEEFYKYCPIGEFGVDLTGKEYIDYEPDRSLYLDGPTLNPTDESANIPNASFEGLISNIDVIKGRIDDPYYGLTLQEAKDLKKAELQSEANGIILDKWPVYTQLNINAGIPGTGDKATKDADVTAVRNECNNRETDVDNAPDVNAVKAIVASWPSI